jgi:hypothetical protein
MVATLQPRSEADQVSVADRAWRAAKADRRVGKAAKQEARVDKPADREEFRADKVAKAVRRAPPAGKLERQAGRSVVKAVKSEDKEARSAARVAKWAVKAARQVAKEVLREARARAATAVGFPLISRFLAEVEEAKTALDNRLVPWPESRSARPLADLSVAQLAASSEAW